MILILSIGFLVPIWRVKHLSGLNAYVLRNDDTAHGYVTKTIRFCLISLLLFSISINLSPSILDYLGTIKSFANIRNIIGITLIILAAIWGGIAQWQMGKSWRIGIDFNHNTDLIDYGLFKYSRNPIFLSIIIMLMGFFIIYANIISAIILTAAIISIQIQVRFEEDFLFSKHSQTYSAYREKVRRWL